MMWNNPSRSRLAKQPTTQVATQSATKGWLDHWPIAVLASIFWLVVIIIWLMVNPASIANVLIAQAYLPFLLPWWLAWFFTGSFLLLNSRRSFFIAGLITWLTLLKLAQVILTSQVMIISSVVFITPLLMLEIWLTLSRKK